MGRKPPYKSVLVMGIESWPLQLLLDRMSAAGAYNQECGYESIEDCPRHWAAYCSTLDAEWCRRGQPMRLF